ncbi:MAG: GNAT family N-acetyltransferase [Oscillospiraceae bacterium]
MNDDLRLSLLGDEPGLKHIWKTVFGDSEADIDAFFERLYTPGRALVCEAEGKLVSAAYVVPLGELAVPEGQRIPCSVVYALGTLPEYRAHGIGRRIAAKAAALSCASGVGVICPAEPWLFDFYADCAGFAECFNVYEASGSDAGTSLFGSVRRVVPDEYSALRRRLLSDRVYIDYNRDAMAYQEYLCTSSGGGLYSVTAAGVQCAAAVEVRGEKAVIKELIVPTGRVYDPAALICRALKLREFTYRTPIRPGEEGRPFAMIRNTPVSDTPDTGLSWFGFAFD